MLGAMKIALLLAGNNQPSNSAYLSELFAAGLRQAYPTAEITTLRLAELDIPHFTLAAYDADHSPTPDTHRLHEVVKNADGIVVASPVWNFSVPAHLKNALDHLGAVCLDQATHSKGQLKNRPCYFLFTGGAPMIAWKALLNITPSTSPRLSNTTAPRSSAAILNRSVSPAAACLAWCSIDATACQPASTPRQPLLDAW